ncbi:DUF3152 domain-containing protein [Streptacidiphilus sp. N1-12]|uniref:DUF3152 domain-containing protein n=2 Tax=Streptacidiphilus alkalitolerans TaxID=3342712 RepID=A0ABV6VIE8_9ACTN
MSRSARRRPPARSASGRASGGASGGGRRRAQGRSSRRRRAKPSGGSGKTLVLVALVLVAVLGLGGYVLHDATRATATAGAASTGASTATAAATPSTGPDRAALAPATPSHSAPPTPAAFPTTYPNSAKGTYSYATGGTKRFGTGTLQRYKVAVENGLGVTPAAFAAQVDAILDNTQRGWSARGLWSFQRVSSGPVAFTIYLTSPNTTYHFCEQLIHLDIRESAPGGVNCSNNGDTVVENIARWIDLTQYYKGQPDLYHALAINHEVGHSLHHGHVSCAGAGDPAPVMMQQIKGLHGCVPNGWPYSADGTYITGPPAP